MFGEKHELEHLRAAILELVCAVRELSRVQHELVEQIRPKYPKTTGIQIKIG